MKTLQNIWSILTSENQLFIDLNGIPCIFIEAYLYMLIFTTVLNIKSTTRKKFLFVFSFSIISLLNTYFGIPPFNTFVNLISIPVLVLLIFRTSVLKAILSEIVLYVIALLFGTIIMTIYSAILRVPSSVTSIIPIHKICFSLFYYTGLYFIYKLFKRFNIKFSLSDKFNIKNSHLLITNFLIGSIALAIEYYLLFNYIDFMPNPLVFLTSFIVSLYFAISMFSLIRTSKLEETTQNLEEQKMYNKTLSTLHDNIRGFKHDFNNIIQAIGGYISVGNMDGLKSYYKDLLEECQLNNNLAVLNPELINNPAIYSLLTDKYYKAEKHEIKLSLEIMADLSNLNIKTYELTRILGILLDNAIEAASQCDEKIVNVIFRNDKNRNKTLIIVQNSYINKGINIDRIFEKGYTSREDNAEDNKSEGNHGLGLWEVRKYLTKNSNLDLYTTKTKELFTQQFEIYN